MIGRSLVLANFFVHGDDAEFYAHACLYVDKAAGGSMGSVVPRGPIDKLKLPAFFASSSPMSNRDLAALGTNACVSTA